MAYLKVDLWRFFPDSSRHACALIRLTQLGEVLGAPLPLVPARPTPCYDGHPIVGTVAAHRVRRSAERLYVVDRRDGHQRQLVGRLACHLPPEGRIERGMVGGDVHVQGGRQHDRAHQQRPLACGGVLGLIAIGCSRILGRQNIFE